MNHVMSLDAIAATCDPTKVGECPVAQKGIEQSLYWVGVTAWTLILMMGWYFGMEQSSEMQSLLVGAALFVLSGFVLALRRLASMMLRLVEVWGRYKVKRWAEARGIDPDEILED